MLLVPRRIINPTCTSNFSSGTTTTDLVLTAYIEPVGGVQYYRVHPKYFYATSGGSITVCLRFFYDKPGLNKHYINQFILNLRIKDQKRCFFPVTALTYLLVVLILYLCILSGICLKTYSEIRNFVLHYNLGGFWDKTVYALIWFCSKQVCLL